MSCRAHRTIVAALALVAFLAVVYLVASAAFHNLVLLTVWAVVLLAIVWAADIGADLFHDWRLERGRAEVWARRDREAAAIVDDLPAVLIAEGTSCRWLSNRSTVAPCLARATSWRAQQSTRDDRLFQAVPVCEAHRG